MHPAEETLIKTFVLPHRRERWLLSLTDAKRRRAFLDRLNHCSDLDPNYAAQIAPSADAIELLKSHGAPSNCYVLSDAPKLDGREMSLQAAVSGVEAAGWGSIVVCIPEKLAYFYGECGGHRSLLRR